MSAIKREERIGNQRLILGDCLEVMKELGRFDACVTDPPYGIQDMVGGYGRGGVHKILNDTNLDVAHSALNTFCELNDDFRMLAFYSCKVTLDFLTGINGAEYFGEIVWDKKIPGLGANFRYQHENCAIFTKGKPNPIGEGFSVISVSRNPEHHPHQKPIQLMERILKISSGNYILDPFMGSGSTIVACEKMGLSGTGIELDPQHFETACKRVDEASRQPDMFVKVAETNAEQGALGL